MISGFTSRELGYGCPLTEAQHERINNRRKDNHYVSEEREKKKLGTTKKAKLTISPFTKMLDIGANHGGYWDFDHMCLQFEDVVDVLKELFPHFDFLFLFDHSNGHDMLRPDGLSITKIRKGFGGSQPIMRDSLIKDDTYLGSHEHITKLNVHDTQRMNYSVHDAGPFYFTPLQQLQRKWDYDTGKRKEIGLRKDELIELLKNEGIVDPKGTKKQMQQRCELLHLPIKKTIQIIEEGWCNKPKGALQVLYERGFIDPLCDAIKTYTMKGKKQPDGSHDETTSINHLMSIQPDFQDQETLLMFYGRQLGVIVDRTPKCHPELAGEGIEYAWGAAKLYYRKQPLKDKRNKLVYEELVKRSLSDQILSLQFMRQCSRRARRYILAYRSLSMRRADTTSTNVDMKLIENLVKKHKSHRSAVDFDSSFINNLLLNMKKLGKIE